MGWTTLKDKIATVLALGSIIPAIYLSAAFLVSANTSHSVAKAHTAIITHLEEDNKDLRIRVETLTSTINYDKFLALRTKKIAGTLSSVENIQYCQLYVALKLGDSCEID